MIRGPGPGSGCMETSSLAVSLTDYSDAKITAPNFQLQPSHEHNSPLPEFLVESMIGRTDVREALHKRNKTTLADL